MGKAEKRITFNEVLDRWKWKPIRNCPGRFIFASGASDLTVDEVCGAPVESVRFISAAVPDEVIAVEFATGGGLISYVKEDDKFLHTLCDAEGFARKIIQLDLNSI